MAYYNLPKMSLVARYDDLCRYAQVLTSCSEEEFKIFVENQLKCALKWKNSEFEVKKLHQKISNLESKNGCLETNIKHLKNLLKGANSTREEIKNEKKSLERQISIIKEVLLADGVMNNQTREKLNLLSFTCKQNSQSHPQTVEHSAGSLLSPSDIDTDDDLEMGRRSSISRGRRSKGKRRSSETRVQEKKIDDAELFINRISEDSNIPFISSEQPSNSYTPENPATSKKYNSYEARCNTDSASVSRYSTLLNKHHRFVPKIVTVRGVKCLSCNKNIRYLKQSLKCQVCGVTICDQECLTECLPVCFPICNLPARRAARTIADYTSSTFPMIPPLIVHCVREIESRGLEEIGLYRISAADGQVKTLKERFVTSHTIPRLKDVDIHVLCGVVKHFLRSLNEAVVTQKAWHQLVEAANLQDDTESRHATLGIVMGLPQPNRDTLAFLMLHLQMIVESPAVRMTIDNLATTLGPTIVGFSSADADMVTEMKLQKRVMKRLLFMPSDTWRGLLSTDTEIIRGIIKSTSENLPAQRETRLGPIYSSVQKSRSLNLRKTPITPRKLKYNKDALTFASPSLQ